MRFCWFDFLRSPYPCIGAPQAFVLQCCCEVLCFRELLVLAWQGSLRMPNCCRKKNDRTPDITQADDDAGMFFMAMPDFIIYFDQCLI